MKTLNIILCDDDPKSIEQMQENAKRLGKEFDVDMNVSVCADGDMLLNCYQENTDILFLDVEMPLIDGIQAAAQIRERDARVVIVFMSRFERYAIKGYYAGAWRYLLKPVRWDDFRKEMEIPVKKLLREKDQTIHIKNDAGVYAIPLEEVSYLEVNSKKNVDIHTSDRVIECYHTLSEMEKMLPTDHFFRCHNSFIVNFDYIVKIENDLIQMRGGENVMLSRRRKREFMQKYMEHSAKLL